MLGRRRRGDRGGAAPTFRDCAIDARRSGVRVRIDPSRNSSTPRASPPANGPARARRLRADAAELSSWRITNTRASSRWTTRASPRRVRHRRCSSWRRAGIDVSDRARASSLNGCRVFGNVGGGVAVGRRASTCEAESSKEGHRTPCSATNEPHPRSATARAWRASWTPRRTRPLVAPGVDGTTTLEHPDAPTALPPESGCFKFEHDVFDRKQ